MSKLYWRLLAWFLGANLVTLLVSLSLTQAVVQGVSRALPAQQVAQEMQRAYQTGGNPGYLEMQQHWRSQGIDAYLFKGGALVTPERLPPPIEMELGHFLNGPDMQRQLFSGDQAFTVTVPDPAGGELKVVGFQPANARKQTPAWLPIVVQLSLSVLVLAAVSWLFVRNLGAPLRSVSGAVRRFAAGELSARVGEHAAIAGDEIGSLAADFDAMATRIQTLVAQRDALLHQISHELRSPLARLNFAFELARSEPAKAHEHMARAEQEIARLDALVGEIIGYIRLDAELERASFPPLDLAKLAADVSESARLEAGNKNLELLVEVPEGLTVNGDQRALSRALDNVLRNAIRHSPAGGRIRVSGQVNNAMVALEVMDEGPGVPSTELPRLFEPFFRGQGARQSGGFGLGLAIVIQVMRAHGGGARAYNRESGGLVVNMEFPRHNRVLA